MRTTTWLAAAAAAALSGCAGAGTQPATSPQAVFDHRVSSSEVTVHWSCTRDDAQVLRVEGVVRNIGSRPVEFAEVEMVAVGAADRSLGSARAAVRDIVLQTNQDSPFLIQLRTLGDETRFDMYYWYWAGEGFGPRGAGRRRIQNLARDACSATQHRSPRTTQ